MKSFLFFYMAIVFLAVTVFSYLAFRNTEGGVIAKIFMGAVTFLVFCALAYILLEVLRPLLLRNI